VVCFNECIQSSQSPWRYDVLSRLREIFYACRTWTTMYPQAVDIYRLFVQTTRLQQSIDTIRQSSSNLLIKLVVVVTHFLTRLSQILASTIKSCRDFQTMTVIWVNWYVGLEMGRGKIVICAMYSIWSLPNTNNWHITISLLRLLRVYNSGSVSSVFTAICKTK